MIGADERASSATGYRESPQSWHKLLVDLRHRGLEIGPKLAIGDGNLGCKKRYAPGLRRGPRAALEEAFDHFVDAYGAKYDKAVTCLAKDWKELLISVCAPFA